MICATLALLAPVDAKSTFQKAVAWADRQAAVAAEVSITLGPRLGDQKKRYVVKGIKPNRAEVRILRPATTTAVASDRTFALANGRIIAWDSVSQEWLEKKTQSKVTNPYNGIIQGTGDFEEPVRFLLDSAYYKKFLGIMRDTQGWTTQTDSKGLTTLKTQTEGNRNELVFDPSGRLVAMRSSAGLDATLRYLPNPNTVATKAPAGYTKTTVFRERPRPPRYQSDSARAIMEACLNAHWRLKQASYRATTEDGKWTVSYDKGNFTSVGGGKRVSVQGQVVSVGDSNGARSKQARGDRMVIQDFLKAGRVTVDGFVSQLWRGVNPVQAGLTPDSVVSHKGSLKIKGLTHDIIEIQRPGYKNELLIRRVDRMIAQSLVTVGGVTTRRDIEWLAVNKPAPKSLF